MKKSNKDVYLIIAVALLLGGFALGILFGFAFKQTKLTYVSSVDSRYNNSVTEFNTPLMLIMWAGGGGIFKYTII